MLKYYPSFIRYSKLLIQDYSSKTIYPSKMTIISTHRVHSYKASASLHSRDLSPKKVNIQKNYFTKKYNNKQSNKTKILNNNNEPAKLLSTLITALANNTSGFQYKVLIPANHTYEEDTFEDTEELITEDDMEEAWAYYDYLEYLYD